MKIKKNYFYAGLVLALILAAVIFYYNLFNQAEKKPEQTAVSPNGWGVDKNGYLSYPLDRGEVKFRRDNHSETEKLIISKIVYQSEKGDIYGLLVLPKTATNLLPGVVLLPGAGVSKESELKLAMNISELGIAVLTIDQRSVGETGGDFPSTDEDYNSFVQNKEPYQHLMVYDALRGFDLLRSAPFIDPGRVVIAGESLGGRLAAIATAIDRNVAGALLISTAGFDFKAKGDVEKDEFVLSIDSDHYIGLITPRKIVMIHSINDTTITLSSAVNTFSKAQNPKAFFLINDTECRHGYCDAMYPGIVQGLKYLVGSNQADGSVEAKNP